LLPLSISHIGVDYELGHLQQVLRTFSWVCEDGVKRDFSVRVRYTNHCISVTSLSPAAAGEHVFDAGENFRVFDIDRHQWSLELPEIIYGLFKKPTTTIQLTPEFNGYIFKLYMKHALGDGERYYCFVRLKRSHEFQDGQSPVKLDLFVESAYPRKTEPFRINERHMFGRLAERLIK
jgi:hypothetical protein